MPRPILKPCLARGCSALVRAPASYCPPCLQQRNAARRRERGELASFYWSTDWRRFRELFLAERPICERCDRAPATEIHHTRGLAAHPEDAFDRRYLEALCRPCHSRETIAELNAKEVKP